MNWLQLTITASHMYDFWMTSSLTLLLLTRTKKILFQMSFCLSNLILTSHATPYLQNGVVRELTAKPHFTYNQFYFSLRKANSVLLRAMILDCWFGTLTRTSTKVSELDHDWKIHHFLSGWLVLMIGGASSSATTWSSWNFRLSRTGKEGCWVLGSWYLVGGREE